MIKYKIDVYSMLAERGINTTVARNTGIFSQSVMQKFKEGDTSITIECLNRLCNVLSLQPSDILKYVPTDFEFERMDNIMKETPLEIFLKVDNNDWTFEHVAQSIGGAVMNAQYISATSTNRVGRESDPIYNLLESINEGYNQDKTYNDLYDLCKKLTYTLKVLNDNSRESALKFYSLAMEWLVEHKNEKIDKRFYYNYALGWHCNIFRRLDQESLTN